MSVRTRGAKIRATDSSSEEREQVLIVQPEAPKGILAQVKRFLMLHVFCTALFLPVMLFMLIAKRKTLLRLISLVSRTSMKVENPEYKDPELLKRVWDSKIGRMYRYGGDGSRSENKDNSEGRGGAHYQVMEGYCGPATLWNILNSIASFPRHSIPAQTRGPMNPSNWCKKLHGLMESESECAAAIKGTDIVQGDVPYSIFLREIRKSNDPRYRVAANFLRPALFSFVNYLPGYILMGLLGGHFSPVLGVFDNGDNDDDPLIAMFDLNSAYGLYMVPARRFYDAVQAPDLMTGKSRALVVVEINKTT
jgi:hypothetical protein